ncbi:MAG: serine hydrolase [Acidobacteriota bacterium]
MYRFRSLALSLLLVLLFVSPSLAASAAGHWEGAIEIPGGAKLAFLIDLRSGDGKWDGSIDIPVQGLKARPLVEITINGDAVKFGIEEGNGIGGKPTFDGKLSSDGQKISGNFSQGGASLSFSMERKGEAAAAAPAKSDAERLSGFDAFADKARADWKVQGFSVAIVKDGKVVLAKGFGLRDSKNNLPVTEHTQFAIGSSTKAFTATVLAMLVEQGKVEWDKPVSEYMPDFKLYDEKATLLMTPADLVSHVSGLPRHDLMWYSAPFSREEIFKRLRFLPNNVSFRGQWQYNNLMFLTAGLLEERVTGESWEKLVQSRIFDPLGMSESNLSVKDLVAYKEPSKGYKEDDKKNTIEETPYRNIDAAGPAGSINSTAVDMAKWVMFQMSEGKVGDKQVVNASSLQYLHSPRAIVASNGPDAETPYMMYGKGWFVEPYRGTPVIHHGGNIDGFSALVAFVPSQKLGVVVLTNMSGTPLPTIIANSIFDRYLDLEPIDWNGRILGRRDLAKSQEEAGKTAKLADRRPNTKPSHAFADYAGSYANDGYGELVVTQEKDGSLRLTMHGLSTAIEHFHYDTFRCTQEELAGTPIRFGTNLRGDIDTVLLQTEPTLDPAVFTKTPPKEMYDPKFLAQFAGSYELASQTIVISVEGDHLLASIGPQQLKLQPYRDTEFDVEKLKGYSARFVLQKGKVVAMMMVQPDGVYEAKKK